MPSYYVKVIDACTGVDKYGRFLKNGDLVLTSRD